MGFIRIFVALICFFVGMALSFTGVGAIIGIPLLAVGIYLLYKEKWNFYKKQSKRTKEAISDGIKGGIAEALKERDNAK